MNENVLSRSLTSFGIDDNISVNITPRLCPLIKHSKNAEAGTVNIVKELDEPFQETIKCNNSDVYVKNIKVCNNNSSRIQTSDVKPHLNTTFNNLNIDPSILLAITEKRWEWPSPIQEATILKIIKRKHVIARSKNGTGKTGAYIIGILNNINVEKKLQAIIAVPTRELALQTANVCISLAKYNVNIKTMVTIGGTDLAEDLYRLSQSINIVIGTPGRILDLFSQREDLLHGVESIVFDEADKLLSDNFRGHVEEILSKLPKNCQKILFSATFPVGLTSFINEYLDNCEYCNVMEELTLKGVTQFYAYLKENQKVSCLKILIADLEIQQSIIFCNSTKRVELLAKYITEAGYSTYFIHSQMKQNDRNRVFHDFRFGFVTFLVCTDIISRGIDVPTVNVIFNFDFPRFNETYLHRIGRCGRFGHLGIAINFITEKDKSRFQQFENDLDSKIYVLPRNIDKRLYVSSYQTSDHFEH